MRIRRRGRHKTPSQVEKVAEKAGRAAPAMAIAGALVAAPQAQHAVAAAAKQATVTADVQKPAAEHQQQSANQQSGTATLDSVSTHSVLVSSASKARHAAAKTAAKSTYYRVRSGDTLSRIAGHYYHNASAWQWLYHENSRTVSNPDMIYPGQRLYIPAHAPANYTLTSYVPRHAKPATPVTRGAHDNDGDNDGSGHVVVQSASHGSDGGHSGSAVHQSSGAHRSGGGLSGTLGCSGLERLWEQAGGNPAHARMAAEIAMAESGGNQYAHSPTDDFGYWQINASNGSLATYDAYGNARSAVIISHNGTDWYPWTTYTSGAYAGRC